MSVNYLLKPLKIGANGNILPYICFYAKPLFILPFF